jgi:hypothetical protein
MLYDLASGPPPVGTLLESVFMELVHRRMELRFLEKRIDVAAALVSLQQKDSQLPDLMEKYANRVFPFLESTKKNRDVDAKKALESWTSKTLKIRPIWEDAPTRKRAASKLRQQKAQLEEMREQRKRSRNVRME